MTDPQPQPEYIINEGMVQCIEAWTKRYPEVSKDIANVIRNRPHTPAAPVMEPKPLRYSGVTVFTHPELSRHDAAIRKAEREHVLDALGWC